MADADPRAGTTAETRARITAALSGPDAEDLLRFLSDLRTSALGELAVAPPRPELRRPPRPSPALFRIRADLHGSKPPIWRRLELRSDLSLERVHRALQTAFGWTDSHLYRFALGGDPFDRSSQVFLCPWDVEEADADDDGSPATADVRLDETLSEPGDRLAYVYDYGDDWQIRLRLEAISDWGPGTPVARLTGGKRAAPPEDCGGIYSFQESSGFLGDAESDGHRFDFAAFDPDEVNLELTSPTFTLAGGGVDPHLGELLYRLGFSEHAEDLNRRAMKLVAGPEAPIDPDELLGALAPVQWFLDRAGEDGMTLTAAGYMRPVDVVAACDVLPSMRRWSERTNREANSGPLIGFRTALQRCGLLRKHHDRLLLTRLGEKARSAPELLWNALADRLIPDKPEFEATATRLLALFAASSGTDPLPMEEMASALTALGWQSGNGRPVTASAIYPLGAYTILTNLTRDDVPYTGSTQLSRVAAELARAALLTRGA